MKFVQEIVDKDGEPYREKAMQQIVCFIKCHLDEMATWERTKRTTRQ